ncbi:glycerol-3-phosphate dehydrogenase/oxidase [Winogradskyella litoriviva]|uniref:Glycerol-3-phosphate dehydrogenase/oxidase n=1 Tax=Winogradskyella litoriviva TaxID=1220182 RepID=A0ABX2E3I1_9FLAO|nr:glycerol-3-phosphate dehydrogenase/oxidase [Winogradskyella litoriviva]NRD22354.1 glycerol-3-phosphate dehydrogenase/oxidase [Winogradskyella litoriviva]
MNRAKMIDKLRTNSKTYDFVIIGGGATGIGIALEASARGYSVVLLEKSDFTKSTSSKATKLVHGGVRYLAQGDIGLVREAVVERGLMLQNAPHITKSQSFIIPTHGLYDEILYTVGLTFYDLLAGKLSLGRSKRISKAKTLKRISLINPDKISAGVVYYDGQFDDSRMAINTLQSSVEMGAIALNYCAVDGLTKNSEGKVIGVSAHDEESGEKFEIKGKQIVNATGVFADDILQMDSPGADKTIAPSQGVHLMLDKSFLPGDDAITIPKTDDGRVLFLVPWHNRVIVGTTDTPLEKESLEPVALEEEIGFILSTAGRYLTKAPQRSDVLSVFAGLRPLAAPKKEGSKTKEISRSHKIYTSNSGLLTMVGGKWTTFRRMGEDLVNKAEKNHNWKHIPTKTKHLKIHGYKENVDYNNPLYFYGSDEENIIELSKEKGWNTSLSDSLGIIEAQVVWAVRNEMAIHIEDFLARRVRSQLLDAKESLKMAPKVAQIMAKELNKDENWQQQQITNYTNVTSNYII